MKKIIRLTENDLLKIVKRVIKEQTIEPIQGKGQYITRQFNTGIIPTKTNFLSFDFVGFKSKPVQVEISPNTTPKPQTNSVCEIVLTDISSDLISYLKTIIGYPLGGVLSKSDGTKLNSDEFSIVTTKLRQLQSTFLTNIGYMGDPERSNDVFRWIDTDVVDPNIVNRDLLLNQLKIYLTAIRKYSDDLKNGKALGNNQYLPKIEGFPTFPLPPNFRQITDVVNFQYQLEIPGTDNSQTSKSEIMFIESIGKLYYKYLKDELVKVQGNTKITIPNINEFINNNPTMLPFYQKLQNQGKNLNIVNFVIFIKTAGSKDNRF